MGPDGGGGGADPYASGRWVDTLPPGYKRIAPETYWSIRSMAPSVRQYLTLFYRGPKNTQEWNDMWNIAQSVDGTLEIAYRHHGYPGVTNALDTDDRLEHWFSRKGAEVAFDLTGDASMKRELQSSLAPGNSHIIPGWVVAVARDVTKQLYLQQGRISGSLPPAVQDQDDGQQQGGRRRRRAPKPKPNPVAQQQGGANK